MKIRDFQPADAQALYTLFYESVHQVASRDYNFEQRKAWAPIDYDQQAWVERLAKNKPYVVEQQGQPVAFADLQANGYIDQFFVSAHMPRQGIGTYLMQHLLQQAKLHHMPLLFKKTADAAT
jgi:putative acetyltransferase